MQNIFHWISLLEIIICRTLSSHLHTQCWSVPSAYSRKTPHSSPVRATYGVSFVSTKFDWSFATVTMGCVHYHVVYGLDISGVYSITVKPVYKRPPNGILLWLLELNWVALGHLDELQKLAGIVSKSKLVPSVSVFIKTNYWVYHRYHILFWRWSLRTCFTVIF